MEIESTGSTAALAELVSRVTAREPLGAEQPAAAFVRNGLAAGTAHYQNVNARLGIDFAVERLPFPHLQTFDPRLVRIAPAHNNERHRHAHESIFVILAGHGEVVIGDNVQPVTVGDIAFVPRWIFHQTRNTSTTAELVVLALTDFGFTSAILGDYDHRTRVAASGDDAISDDAAAR